MSGNVSLMLEDWKSFNLSQLQKDLDASVAELVERQDASDASRIKLIEKSKEFKKEVSEEVLQVIAPLVRSFQAEVDALTKRSLATERDFLNLYKKLAEVPDPLMALEQADTFQKRAAQRQNDADNENRRLKETLASYEKELSKVKTQGDTATKSLSEKVREFEEGAEGTKKRLGQDGSKSLRRRSGERKIQETGVHEAERTKTFRAVLAASQSELFNSKSKHNEDLRVKQAEIEDLTSAEAEGVDLGATVSKNESEKSSLKQPDRSGQSCSRMTSTTAMEEALEVLSRSSLEAELCSKDKEIYRLTENVRRLQESMGKLRECSTSTIVKLELELTEKNQLLRDLQRRKEETEDYEEIKRELQIIKSAKFASPDSGVLERRAALGDTQKSTNAGTILLQKSRPRQSESSTLRTANAQVRGRPDRRPVSSSPVRPGLQPFLVSPAGYASSEKTHSRKEQPTTPHRHRRLSSASRHSQSSHRPHPFSPGRDFGQGLSSAADALSQSQLNALLNLKILAGIKAAAAAQNVNATPLLMNLLGLASNQSPPNPLSPNAIPSPHVPRTRVASTESQVFVEYLSRLRALGGGAPVTSRQSWASLRSDQELSDNSDDESLSYSHRNSTHRRLGAGAPNLRRPSDPCNSAKLDPRLRLASSPLSRCRSHSHGEKLAFAEDVDTEELTCQVRELLQANNIGQRAFGQYVLGLSQGSVSEILSKPKPWSKLTFKGKEPFYKMIDFVSSPRNVDTLKLLQRRDREERVLCGARSYHPLPHTDPESDQVIANILATSREDMKADEQEQLKRAQEIYPRQKEKDQNEVATPRTTTENAEKIQLSSSTPTIISSRTMATVASSPCSASLGMRITEKINPPRSTTNGAAEGATTATNSSLPSLIKLQQLSGTGNENGRLLRQDTSGKDRRSSQSRQQHYNRGLNGSLPGSKDEGVLNICSSGSDFITGKEVTSEQCKIFDSDSLLVKAEPTGQCVGAEYLGTIQKGVKNSATTKEETLFSATRRLINSQLETERLRRLLATSSYSDPFFPSPPSPTAEDTKDSIRSSSRTPPGVVDDSTSFEAPFIGDDSSHYVDGSSERSATEDSSHLETEPALFKELSDSSFEGPLRENSMEAIGASNAVPSTFSSLLSSGMPLLQSTTSIFDTHASYTELSPVTTGSLFNPRRDPNGQHFTTTSGPLSTADGSQNGISSMLPPLAMGSHQHGTSPVPTYSTLMNSTVSSTKFSEGHAHGRENFGGDSLPETSTLTTPIPPETLHKMSASQVDTALLTKRVRDRLVRHGICQRTFGEKILGLSQGTVSDILSHPKAWCKMTPKGREPFVRMMMWLSDGVAGGLLPSVPAQQHDEGSRRNNLELPLSGNASRSSSCSPNTLPVNLTKEQREGQNSINGDDSGSHHATFSPHSVTNSAPSPHDRMSPVTLSRLTAPQTNEAHGSDHSTLTQIERNFKAGAPSLEEQPDGGSPITPLQQMLNIQELAANCPKLDTFVLTRKVKDLLTEHNIGQRIFGQAVLGLTQGSVSDLLSRPKLWRSLSLKGREPFVRMQLWLSDPNNIDQLKNLKLERWMERKWSGKRSRSEGGAMHSLSPVKKQRIVLSAEEKDVLRRAYAIEPYPSQETVDLLAIKLTRKSSTIVNWFHNYRSRVKRGFFPGEQLQDGSSKKHGGLKMTVKQLLEGIILTEPPSSTTTRGSFNPQRPFSSKNGHHGSGSVTRRSGTRTPTEVSPQSWAPSHASSPPSFDSYPDHHLHHINTETMDQHFQNLQRSCADDLYTPNSAMHVKEEAKMIQHLHSDVMFNPPYPYQMVNTSIPDLFKSSDVALGGDPIAMAAASSFIQPKAVHETSGAHFSTGGATHLYTNLDDLHHRQHQEPQHHDSYAAASMPNELTSFSGLTKVAVSPPSPHTSSMLPPVHTLTPKKSFGSSPSNSSIVLPSASSLLNSSMEKLGSFAPDLINPALGYGGSGGNPQRAAPMHRLVNLSRPRYDTVIASNNNMNNNSCPDVAKNVNLPVVARMTRSHAGSESNGSEVRASVWVSSDQSDESIGDRENVRNSPAMMPETSVSSDQARYVTTSDTAATETGNPKDGFEWIF